VVEVELKLLFVIIKCCCLVVGIESNISVTCFNSISVEFQFSFFSQIKDTNTWTKKETCFDGIGICQHAMIIRNQESNILMYFWGGFLGSSQKAHNDMYVCKIGTNIL
jgi:hypothetical protein